MRSRHHHEWWRESHFSRTDIRGQPDFARWTYDPTGALDLLRQHCTGGPSVPSAGAPVWTCGGVQANVRFMYERTDPRRAIMYRMFGDELARVGIALGDDGLTTSQLFGANGITSADDDLFEFAWGFFGPSGGTGVWSCHGSTNYLNYCNGKVTSLLQSGAKETNPRKSSADFRKADALLAADVPSIPLYDRPWPLVRADGLLGTQDSALQVFTWNVEDWHWSK